MLHEFLQNFLHNLFKPLLLFFYFGFLIPILKVDFEFPCRDDAKPGPQRPAAASTATDRGECNAALDTPIHLRGS